LAEIEHTGTEQSSSAQAEIPAGRIRLYARTDICFYQQGIFTAALDETLLVPQELAPSIKLVPEECYIQTNAYHVWNGTRNSPDALRQVICAGSVISFDSAQSIPAAIWQQGLGEFRQEGLGQVLINPAFLTHPPQRKEVGWDQFQGDVKAASIASADKSNNKVLAWLKEQQERPVHDSTIDALANEFEKDYGKKFEKSKSDAGISPSQWGTIRSIAGEAKSADELFRRLFSPLSADGKSGGILNRGQSEPLWRKNNRSFHLEKFLKGCFETKLNKFDGKLLQLADRISNQMAKKAK
jgi:hypothetical protein